MNPREGMIVTNFETLGAVATKTFVVPAGKRWLILSGYAERDANATFDVKITDADDKTLWQATQVAAGTSQVSMFGGASAASHRWGYPPLLAAGMKVKFDWGAAQTTPEVALLVVEYDL